MEQMSWAACSLYSGGAKVLQVSCLTYKTWCHSGNSLNVSCKALGCFTSWEDEIAYVEWVLGSAIDLLTEGDRNCFTKALLQLPIVLTLKISTIYAFVSFLLDETEYEYSGSEEEEEEVPEQEGEPR